MRINKEYLEVLSLVILIFIHVVQGILSLYSRGVGDAIGSILFIVFILISFSSYWRDSYKLFIIGSLVGFFFEIFGVNTGIPFGRYEYIGFGRFILFGVPIPIIFTWGMYLVYSYLLSTYLNKSLRLILSGLLLVILDLAIDPVIGFIRYMEVEFFYGCGMVWYSSY